MAAYSNISVQYQHHMHFHHLLLLRSEEHPWSTCRQDSPLSKTPWARLSCVHRYFCICHPSILPPLLFCHVQAHTQLLRYLAGSTRAVLIPCPVLPQSALSLAFPNVRSVAVSSSASAPPSAPTARPSPPQNYWPFLSSSVACNRTHVCVMQLTQ